MVKKTDKVKPRRPRWKHDKCSNCVFLGRLFDCDLWVCEDPYLSEYTLRHGNPWDARLKRFDLYNKKLRKETNNCQAYPQDHLFFRRLVGVKLFAYELANILSMKFDVVNAVNVVKEVKEVKDNS